MEGQRLARDAVDRACRYVPIRVEGGGVPGPARHPLAAKGLPVPSRSMSSAENDTPATGNASVGNVVIIGAGPAGLTAAYELTKSGVTSTVLEADSVVGGISRTVQADGWRFDIGGH